MKIRKPSFYVKLISFLSNDFLFQKTQEVGSSTHFLAQSGTTTHFGLGSRVTNVTVHVTWPATGARLYLYNVPPNIKLRVVEPWRLAKASDARSI